YTLSFPPSRTPPSSLCPYTTLFRSVLGKAPRRYQKLEPARMAAFGPGLDPAQEVALGDDAYHGSLVNDRQAADSVPQHPPSRLRSEEHTSELQSPYDLVCRLLLEKK